MNEQFASTFGKISGKTLYCGNRNHDSLGTAICSFAYSEEAKAFKAWLFRSQTKISGTIREKKKQIQELKNEFLK